MSESKASLEKEFFNRVPNARPASPVFRKFFEFMYQAHLAAHPGARLLNIFSSHDFSANREEVYREKFFSACEYDAIDFWEDSFIYNGEKTGHQLPFKSKSFDILVTTKIILEHLSDPQKVIAEFYRILKTGGEAFVVAPLVRRQHQKPHDYFRYTEFGLRHLFEKAGFNEIQINYSNGAMVTLATYAYFFQRGIKMPHRLELFLNWVHKWIIEPIAFWLDKFDRGYGRDMTLYFFVRARKN